MAKFTMKINAPPPLYRYAVCYKILDPNPSADLEVRRRRALL